VQRVGVGGRFADQLEIAKGRIEHEWVGSKGVLIETLSVCLRRLDETDHVGQLLDDGDERRLDRDRAGGNQQSAVSRDPAVILQHRLCLDR
jgi:hypothetical protein